MLFCVGCTSMANVPRSSVRDRTLPTRLECDGADGSFEGPVRSTRRRGPCRWMRQPERLPFACRYLCVLALCGRSVTQTSRRGDFLYIAYVASERGLGAPHTLFVCTIDGDMLHVFTTSHLLYIFKLLLCTPICPCPISDSSRDRTGSACLCTGSVLSGFKVHPLCDGGSGGLVEVLHCTDLL